MNKTAIYVKHKANAQCSLESKIEQCVTFANGNGFEIVEIYCDRVTDIKPKRFELERLLADSKQRKFEIVIVPCVSNLYRKFCEFTKIYRALRKSNVELFDVENNKNIKTLERIGLLV